MLSEGLHAVRRQVEVEAVGTDLRGGHLGVRERKWRDRNTCQLEKTKKESGSVGRFVFIVLFLPFSRKQDSCLMSSCGEQPLCTEMFTFLADTVTRVEMRWCVYQSALRATIDPFSDMSQPVGLTEEHDGDWEEGQ